MLNVSWHIKEYRNKNKGIFQSLKVNSSDNVTESLSIHVQIDCQLVIDHSDSFMKNFSIAFGESYDGDEEIRVHSKRENHKRQMEIREVLYPRALIRDLVQLIFEYTTENPNWEI